MMQQRHQVFSKYVRPLQGAQSFFRRLRVSANGALVEDFDYNHTLQMVESLVSVHNRDNDDIEGSLNKRLRLRVLYIASLEQVFGWRDPKSVARTTVGPQTVGPQTVGPQILGPSPVSGWRDPKSVARTTVGP